MDQQSTRIGEAFSLPKDISSLVIGADDRPERTGEQTLSGIGQKRITQGPTPPGSTKRRGRMELRTLLIP